MGDVDVWQVMRDAAQRHRLRHDRAVHRFKHRLDFHVTREIDIASNKLRLDPAFGRILKPLAEPLRSYMMWMRWCLWLSANLAPAAALTGREDARRLAAAAVPYMGIRLVDDGIDGHADYKGKAPTLLGRLAERDDSRARGVSVMLGGWLVLHGLDRMRREGLGETALRLTDRLSAVALGALAEVSVDHSGAQTVYGDLVRHKAGSYDLLMYESLLAPLDDEPRRRVLDFLLVVSECAQYLNDVADTEDDRAREQPNAVALGLVTPATVRNVCGRMLHEAAPALAHVPADLADGAWAVVEEVLDAASRLRVTGKAAMEGKA